MEKPLTQEAVAKWLSQYQGKEIDLKTIREEMGIKPDSTGWRNLTEMMVRLCEKNIVKSMGKRTGVYKVITQVQPIKVFGTEYKGGEIPFEFPKDYDTGEPFSFADLITIREGDIIVISGVSPMRSRRKRRRDTTCSSPLAASTVTLGPLWEDSHSSVWVSKEIILQTEVICRK